MRFETLKRLAGPAWTLATAILALAVIAAPALADAPTFTKSKYPSKQVAQARLELSEGGYLRFDVDDIDIYVKRASGKTVTVDVFVAGPDEEKAIEFFENEIDFELREEDGELVMSSRSPGEHSWSFWKKHRNIQMWAIVAVPTRFNADIATDDGDVRIDELEGEIKVRTEDGDIDVGTLRGPSIDLKSSDGDVLVDKLLAKDEIIVSTSDGDIRAEHIEAQDISIDTSDGDVEIGRVDGGDTSIRSSDGDIEVEARGKKLRATCADGDIRITLAEAMTVDLRSTDGDIDLMIPESLDVDLELKGDNVSVRGGSISGGNVTRNGVKGSLNKGGPLVRAKSNDGTIALRLR